MKLSLVKDNSILKNLQFKEAFATNTRLMGVVGVMARFVSDSSKEIVHVYHLDFESYGIDGFKEWHGISESDLRRELSKVIGGLGGRLESISFEELICLLKSAYEVQDFDIEDIAFLMKSYPSFIQNDLVLEEEGVLALLKRLSAPLDSDIDCINYFMMRFVGQDFSGMVHLVTPGLMTTWQQGGLNPSTLIKNSVKKVEELVDSSVYNVASLVDFGETYKLMNSQIEVAKVGGKILSFMEMNHMVITAHEAAMQLAKRVYSGLYCCKRWFPIFV